MRQFEQDTYDFLQLHQQSQLDGQTGGVVRICLENGWAESESEGGVIVTIEVEPLQLRDPHIQVIPEHLWPLLLVRGDQL